MKEERKKQRCVWLLVEKEEEEGGASQCQEGGAEKETMALKTLSTFLLPLSLPNTKFPQFLTTSLPSFSANSLALRNRICSPPIWKAPAPPLLLPMRSSSNANNPSKMLSSFWKKTKRRERRKTMLLKHLESSLLATAVALRYTLPMSMPLATLILKPMNWYCVNIGWILEASFLLNFETLIVCVLCCRRRNTTNFEPFCVGSADFCLMARW